MIDISTLKIQIDTRDALTAKTNLDKLDKSISKTEMTATKVSRGFGTLQTAIASIATSATIGQFVKLSDTFTNMNSRLTLVSKSTSEFVKAQNELFEISQKTRTPYESSVELYAKLAMSTESLSLSQERLLKVTEAINKAGIIGGGTKESINAALIQLGQGLASGTLRGEELNSVLEQTPRLAKAIADGMGVQVGALKTLAEQGMITAEQVINSLESQAWALDREFKNINMTVSQSMTVLGNSILATVGGIDSATGASSNLAEAISTIATELTNNKDAIIDFSQTFGAYFGKTIDLVNILVQSAEDGAEYLLGSLNTIVYGTLNGIAQASLKATEALNAVGLSSDETLAKTSNFANEMARQFENATKMMTGAGRDVVDAYKEYNVSIEERISLMKREQTEFDKKNQAQLKSVAQIKAEMESKKQAEKDEAKAQKEAIQRLDNLQQSYIQLAEIGMSEYEAGLYRIALQTQKWIQDGVTLNDALEAQTMLVSKLNEETSKTAGEENKKLIQDRLELMRAEYDLKEKQIGLLDDENVKNVELAKLYNERQKRELEAKKELGEINQELYDKNIQYEDELLSKTAQRYSETGQIIEAVGNSMENSFMIAVDGVLDGVDKLDDAFENLGRQIYNSVTRQLVVNPLVGAITSGIGSYFGGITANAQGGVYSSPSLSNYSNQVHSSPQLFAFAKGGVPNMGVFGEAGAEAIMPLTRTSDGDLGVRAIGGSESQNVKVEIINQGGDKMEVKQASSRQDLEGQVISIVINAIQTNKGGMRTAMGGR